ncbi:MAG: c-type cytochrome [Pedosphaera sp.]|nr:c-type cytochrome [Pedosphaera sp.]
MNHGPLIFLGILFTFASAWCGLVLVPHQQLADLAPNVSEETGQSFPQARPGDAAQGARLYTSLGCVACHTQQVRPEDGGGDIARGWGSRRSVARDYLYDMPLQLGNQRLAPDLANYGERLGTNPPPYLHLYNPRAVTAGSFCSANPFLFTRRATNNTLSPDALRLRKGFEIEVGSELVPTREADQLVAYLRSLRFAVGLPEAPLKTAEETK